MIFAEQPPSKQWAILKYRGEKFAEVWFKPDGDPLGLVFRIPGQDFQIPNLSKQLTMENLLRAVSLKPEDIESWYEGEVLHQGMNGTNADFKKILSPTPPDVPYLDIHVSLTPPTSLALTPEENKEGESEAIEQQFTPATWDELEPRWKTLLGLEGNLDTLRLTSEDLQRELENQFHKQLSMEEKNHGLRMDISEWERAKRRIPHALPKIKDFIHRATWALSLPERKRLQEIYNNHIQPRIPFAGMNEVMKLLADLQKDWQTLQGTGNSVYLECKGVSTEVQSAYRTLQSNAVANAKRKKGDGTPGNKFFKDVRKWSGA